MSRPRKNALLWEMIEESEAMTGNTNGSQWLRRILELEESNPESSSGNSSTIYTGYIVDPVSGQNSMKDYEISKNVSRNKHDINRKNSGITFKARYNNSMMASNFPSALFKREQGQSIVPTGSNKFPDSALNLLTKDLKLTAKVDIEAPDQTYPIWKHFNEVSFVSEGCEAMYAAYHYNGISHSPGSGKTYIWKIPFYHSSDKRQFVTSSLSPMFLRYTTNDVCEGFDDISPEIVGISNPDILMADSSKLIALETNNLIMHSQTPYWCCISNKQRGVFAVGSENSIKICGSLGQDESLPVVGNVFSLRFNMMGTLLLYGTNFGRLGAIDERQEPKSLFQQVENSAINYLAFLSGETHVVYSTTDSKLKLVDLRMLKPVLTYEDHICNHCKVSASVCDSHKLICSTGSDNVTRLWSVYGGKPLLSVHLPSTEPRTFSWLKSCGNYCTLYVLQNKVLHYFDVRGKIDS